MIVELHILQNFAPANLNRDDTGAPKDCEFGGYRRARISSQAIKRAIRRHGDFASYFPDASTARTRRLIVELSERVAGMSPAPADTVKHIAAIFNEAGIERPQQRRGADQEAEPGERDNTKLLLYMTTQAIEDMAVELRTNWDTLASGDKTARSQMIQRLGESLAKSAKAPDIALFGRMIEIDTTKPFGKLQLGVDAACQVAHAISTNRIDAEFDFFTAVDDLLPTGEVGAGMMDVVGFNSSCFYRYANVDLHQLTTNLDDRELALRTLSAFLRASVAAIPTGKQNSFAAQNPPSFVLAVVRERGFWSLANAFVDPIRPGRGGDLVAGSVAALDRYWGTLSGVYGDGSVRHASCIDLSGAELTSLADAKVESFARLVEGVLAAANGGAA